MKGEKWKESGEEDFLHVKLIFPKYIICSVRKFYLRKMIWFISWLKSNQRQWNYLFFVQHKFKKQNQMKNIFSFFTLIFFTFSFGENLFAQNSPKFMNSKDGKEVFNNSINEFNECCIFISIICIWKKGNWSSCLSIRWHFQDGWKIKYSIFKLF